jgi:hypothetical protein
MNITTAKGKGAPQNANDAPLIIEPLTIAYPREPVVHTPKPILTHPAYNGGWKVLRRYRLYGRADLVMTRSFLSFFLISSISILSEIFSNICLMFYVISPYLLVNKK